MVQSYHVLRELQKHLNFHDKFEGQGHKFQTLMINTQLKFEGKIHYGSKVVTITRNYTKLSFKAYLTLKVKVTMSR